MGTIADLLNTAMRDFQRYTGDGLPGEPVGRPLPQGDPASGQYNPTKKQVRDAFKVLADIADGLLEPTAEAIEAAAQADLARVATAADVVAAAGMLADTEAARDSATLIAATRGAYRDTTIAAAISAGIAALVDGDTFTASADDVDYIGLYVINTGAASEIAKLPLSDYIVPVFDTYAQAVALGLFSPRVAYILDDETRGGATTRNFFDGNVYRFEEVVAPFDVTRLFYAGAKGAIYDWTDPSTMFDAVSGGAVVDAEGDLVARVVDQSGNGNDLIQATSANRPLYRTRGGAGIRTGGSSNPCILSAENVIDLDGATKVTVILAHGTRRAEGTGVIAEYGTTVGSTDGSFGLFKGNQTYLRGTATTNRTIQPASQIYDPEYVQVVSAVLDIQGAAAADRFKTYRIGNADIPLGSESGAFANVGPIPFSNQKMNFGARFGAAFPFTGDFFRCLIISGELSAKDLAGAYAWAKAGTPTAPATNVAFVGDSIVAMYLSQFDTPYYIPEVSGHLLAISGNSIAQQQVRWNSAAVDHASLDAVVVRVGLNDLSNGGETVADVIARLQGLIDDINADTVAPVVISQLTPCRTGLPEYAKWQAVNEAIAGGGATPITGVDARVTSHVALLDDGSGNLLPAYDTGDGIHLNNAGREIVATAEKAGLVSAGVIS